MTERRTKLTNRSVEALKADPLGRYQVADTEAEGFYVMVWPSGAKTFGCRYRSGQSRRRVPLGKWGVVTLDQARTKAREVLSAAALGGDPAEDRRRRAAVPTWGTWVPVFVARAEREKKSAAQLRRYLGLAEEGGDVFRSIRRRWSGRALDAITADDVLRARDELRETPVQANRFAAALSSCFSAAIKAGHLKANPARDVPKLQEGPPRQRVLTPREAESVLGAIGQEPDPWARAALLVLLATGLRLTEVLRLRWSDVNDLDTDRPTLTLLSPKAGRPQAIPLPSAVAEVLRDLPRLGFYVVAGRNPEKPRVDLAGPWRRCLRRAGLEEADITLHDLRRTTGLEIYRRDGLIAAQKLLRHSDPRVTASVYVPLAAEDLRDAAERRANLIPFKTTKSA